MQKLAQTFVAKAEQAIDSGPLHFVKDEFQAFLGCGILAHGFVRLRCGDCGHDKLLTFSCNRRGNAKIALWTLSLAHMHRSLLLLATATVIVIWQLPYGRQILYPVSLLATFAHEIGHGLTALLVGAEFDTLVLHADGSGMAVWRGNPGRVATALIAAGGLLGPTLAGITLLLLSRAARMARTVLVVLACLVAMAVLAWVRNPFGVGFLLAMAALLVLAARALPDSAARFLLQSIAITLCLSWFSDLDYMFSAHAVVNGALHASDSAIMADALWLPYWVWGAVVAFVSLCVAALGIAYASRAKPGP